MTKHIARIGTIAALALGLASFTGSAIAGNVNGSTPPGQEKQATPAAPAAPPAAKAPSGQAKQAAKASTSSPGVKPSNSTSKWTHCSTGGSSSAATCTGNGSKADSSKQYGNGKTAAQIANSRGAPAGTVLTGPGNSQPHKVTACGKPNNKSGGVDVHAVKSYSGADCAHSATQSSATETKSDCTGTTVTSTSTAKVHANKHGKVKAHGKHKGLKGKQESAVTSAFTPSNANCGTAAAGTTAAGTTAAGTTSASGTAATGTAVTNGATAGTGNTASAAPAAGGVLGAQATLARPATKRAGGVLGATARLTGGTLPFTGLPIWIAVLVALALIAGGLAFRSRSARPQH